MAYLEILSRHLPERLENPQKTLFRIVGNQAKIQFGCLSSRIMECYCRANLLRGRGRQNIHTHLQYNEEEIMKTERMK